MLASMNLRRLSALGLALTTSATVAACGSRGPLDVGEGATDLDAGLDAPATADVAAPPPLGDGGRGDGSVGPDLPPIVDCGLCLAQQCNAPILACITNPSCQRAFQCVFERCGGKLDASCILQCAQTEPQGAIQVLQIFTCVTQQCGKDCNEVLGQLLGGGEARPDAGPPPTRDAGAPPPPPVPPPAPPLIPGRPGRERTRPLERAFSRWPELLTAPE